MLAVIALAAAIVAIAASSAARERPAGPEPALVTIVNLTARSAVGSYCISRRTGNGTSVTGCADKVYPLNPKGRLPAPPNALVRVDVRRRASSVEWGLVRRDGSRYEFLAGGGHAAPADQSRRRWRLRLPADLQGATDLSLFAKFGPGEDAGFWAGLRPVDRWP